MAIDCTRTYELRGRFWEVSLGGRVVASTLAGKVNSPTDDMTRERAIEILGPCADEFEKRGLCGGRPDVPAVTPAVKKRRG